MFLMKVRIFHQVCALLMLPQVTFVKAFFQKCWVCSLIYQCTTRMKLYTLVRISALHDLKSPRFSPLECYVKLCHDFPNQYRIISENHQK